MSRSIPKIIIAGLVGTAVMTMVGLYGAPMMGMPKMNPAEMLAMQMGGSMALGWMGHFMIGAILAVIYAFFALGRLPGPPAAQGAIFSLAPWLMAMVAMMPMMGMPMFGGGVQPAMGSLVGHLVFGAVMGGMIGTQTTSHS